MTTDSPRLPIFVYGTLRPGHGNARMWEGHGDGLHDGAATVLGYRLTSNGGFPYLVADDGSVTAGCLVEPEPAEYEHVLARMDALEGYAQHSRHNHYERVHVVVHTPEGPVLAWVYIPAAGEMADHARSLRNGPRRTDGTYDWSERDAWRRTA